MTEQPKRERAAILIVAFDPYTITDGVHVVATQGNGVVVEQSDGLVLVDAGPGAGPTERMIADVRSLTDAPVKAITYSHGHIGYNAGVPQWRAHNAERGDAPPDLIAQANAPVRLDRYQRTRPLQLLLNSWQFQAATREALEVGLDIEPPTVTFGDRYRLDDPVVPIEVFAAPSETDDSIALWLPEQKILYGGPAVISGFPNVGTPLRTLRLTERWIATLDALLALDAEILIPEFGAVVRGADEVRLRLTRTADALRWLVDEVMGRMNRGMLDVEIIHDLPPAPDYFDEPYLKDNYGAPDYVVRDLFREQNGWWVTRNPTDLHPAHPDEAAAAVRAAVDADTVLAAARDHIDAGRLQVALHVLDLLALAPGDDEPVQQARRLKAECCDALARQTAPFVSRSLYRGSARLLRTGRTRWSQAPDGLAAAEAETGAESS
ncbi:MAG: alkyl sulfatase dimerization domain-containing protein [Acidimicrobiales bacterium]